MFFTRNSVTFPMILDRLYMGTSSKSDDHFRTYAIKIHTFHSASICTNNYFACVCVWLRQTWKNNFLFHYLWRFSRCVVIFFLCLVFSVYGRHVKRLLTLTFLRVLGLIFPIFFSLTSMLLSSFVIRPVTTTLIMCWAKQNTFTLCFMRMNRIQDVLLKYCTNTT